MRIYVIRHGHAPNGRLSALGREQAARVATELAGAGIERVACSQYPRCLHTIEPLARTLGLDVEVEDALAEDAGLEAMWAYLESLTGTVAVCSHANLLGPVIDRVVHQGAEVDATAMTCETGSVWRLDGDAAGTFTRAVQQLR